ncbi:MAG: 5'/3'-nucleotidase SurE [Deltaproteobacteria bacterium]|nr:5'/3'-nucleotidase SurE [Deltaproteobacteria bacterium]
MSKNKNILVTNDDGILAPGIEALAHQLKSLGNVTVVAPSQERSTTGHSLTLHKPIRVHKMKPGYYHINGNPADCVFMAVKHLFKNKKLDFVVSGINAGPNLGNDIHYSGTVAAAREATFLKVPAMAISLDYHHENELPNFEVAAHISYFLVRYFLEHGIPKQVLMNVNIPDAPLKNIRGVKVTKTGFRYYSDDLVEHYDPRGKSYFWLGGGYLGYEKKIADSDCQAVDQNYVSLTPLHIDTTHEATFLHLKETSFQQLYSKIKKAK